MKPDICFVNLKIIQITDDHSLKGTLMLFIKVTNICPTHTQHYTN